MNRKTLLKLIAMQMAVTPFIFYGVTYLMNNNGYKSQLTDRGTIQLIFYCFLFLSLIIFITTTLMRNTFRKKIGNRPNKSNIIEIDPETGCPIDSGSDPESTSGEKVQYSGAVMILALCESPAITGLAYYFISGDINNSAVFFTLSLIFFVAFWPCSDNCESGSL